MIEKYRERKLEVGRMRKFYLDVTLCSKVVYFSGFDFIDNLYQARAVSQVSVVQLHVYKAQNKRMNFIHLKCDLKSNLKSFKFKHFFLHIGSSLKIK